MRIAFCCILVVMGTGLLGCSTGSSFQEPDDNISLVRKTFVSAWAYGDGEDHPRTDSAILGGELVGTAPLLVGTIVEALKGRHDPFGPDGSPVSGTYSLVQVDFGDADPWEDITDDLLSRRYDGNWDDGVQASGTSLHTYTDPGVYQIRSRATAFDGEVVVIPEELVVTVTVLAPVADTT